MGNRHIGYGQVETKCMRRLTPDDAHGAFPNVRATSHLGG